MRRDQAFLVALQSLFVASGLAMLAAPLVVHGGDPRTYVAGFLFGSLLLAGAGLAAIWAAGAWLSRQTVANFSLASLGILAAAAMALTYDFLAGLAGLAYFCASAGMMEANDVREDSLRVVRSAAPQSRKGVPPLPLAPIARKAAWTAGLASASCALSFLSLLIVFDMQGVLASTALSFLALALIGWLAYNLASGEKEEAKEEED